MADNELQERESQHPSLGSSGERVPTAAGSSREAAPGSAGGTAGGTAASGSAGEAAAADKQKESAQEVLARLSKLKDKKQAPYWDYLEPVIVTETVLAERKVQEDGSVQLQPAAYCRNFWQGHMSSKFPRMAEVSSRLLSAHVTSCATERNWSLLGNIFSKTKNRLALERANKIAFIRGNSSNNIGADQEIMLLEIDVLD